MDCEEFMLADEEALGMDTWTALYAYVYIYMYS